MVIRALAVAFVSAALSCAAAPTATADVGVQRDAAGDSRARGLDLRSVRVANDASRLRIRTRHVNLYRRSPGGVSLWLDTDPYTSGPEFLISGGASAGTDWDIWRTRGWTPRGLPLPCDISMKTRWDRDTITFATGRDCLGRYRKVRVSAVASRVDATTYEQYSDYAPANRRFAAWVRRG